MMLTAKELKVLNKRVLGFTEYNRIVEKRKFSGIVFQRSTYAMALFDTFVTQGIKNLQGIVMESLCRSRINFYDMMDQFNNNMNNNPEETTSLYNHYRNRIAEELANKKDEPLAKAYNQSVMIIERLKNMIPVPDHNTSQKAYFYVQEKLDELIKETKEKYGTNTE